MKSKAWVAHRGATWTQGAQPRHPYPSNSLPDNYIKLSWPLLHHGPEGRGHFGLFLSPDPLEVVVAFRELALVLDLNVRFAPKAVIASGKSDNSA